VDWCHLGSSASPDWIHVCQEAKIHKITFEVLGYSYILSIFEEMEYLGFEESGTYPG
jgi:hypothetical protein